MGRFSSLSSSLRGRPAFQASAGCAPLASGGWDFSAGRLAPGRDSSRSGNPLVHRGPLGFSAGSGPVSMDPARLLPRHPGVLQALWLSFAGGRDLWLSPAQGVSLERDTWSEGQRPAGEPRRASLLWRGDSAGAARCSHWPEPLASRRSPRPFAPPLLIAP